MHKLSQNLKYLLQEAKLSENELARRTGVPQQVINRILSGQNLNPKIATLTPLADYFTISISQLIGDVNTSETGRLSTKHSGWREIPLIDWEMIVRSPIKDVLTQSKRKIAIDLDVSKHVFATQMVDSSMEPKFSEKTLLIFDSKKNISDKDFVLIYSHPEQEVIFRQIFIKKDRVYKKCFNPRCKDYKLTIVNPESGYLGVLIQSRTNHIID